MDLSRNQHVILLYESESSRNLTAARCINQGLEEGQLCIYASVNDCNPSRLTKLSSLIDRYRENINNRNLLIVGLKPFYDSALIGDLTPFNEFKIQLEEELRKRGDKGKNKDVLIIADCADNLFINKRFDQCETVENWWHDIYNQWIQEQQQLQKHQQAKQGYEQNNLTVICPYSASVLVKSPFSQHKYKISHNHSIAIDTEGHLVSGYTKTTEGGPVSGSQPVVSRGELPTRIIIAEPYPDLQQFYSLWLRSRGFKDMIIIDTGRKCIDEFYKSTNGDEDSKCSSNNFPRDAVVILDTHLEDVSSIQVAKQIIDRNPNQQVIFTTTLPSDIISQEISAAGLNKCSVLTKPFELSRLLYLIHQTNNKNS